MKKLILFTMALLMTLAFAACDNNPVEEYGTGLINSKTRAENTAAQANLAGLQQSVQTFRAMNNRFPTDLQELKSSSGMDVDISQYDYDPATGKVTLKQQ